MDRVRGSLCHLTHRQAGGWSSRSSASSLLTSFPSSFGFLISLPLFALLRCLDIKRPALFFVYVTFSFILFTSSFADGISVKSAGQHTSVNGNNNSNSINKNNNSKSNNINRSSSHNGTRINSSSSTSNISNFIQKPICNVDNASSVHCNSTHDAPSPSHSPSSSTSSSSSVSSSFSSPSSPPLSSSARQVRTTAFSLRLSRSPPPPPPYPPGFSSAVYANAIKFPDDIAISNSKINDDNDYESGEHETNKLLFAPQAAKENEVKSEATQRHASYPQRFSRKQGNGSFRRVSPTFLSSGGTIEFDQADLYKKSPYNSSIHPRQGSRHHEHGRPLPRLPLFDAGISDDFHLNVRSRAEVRRRRSVESDANWKSSSVSNGAQEEMRNKAVSKMLNRIQMIRANDSECGSTPLGLTLDMQEFFDKPGPNSRTFAAEVNQTIQVANFMNALYLYGNTDAKLDLHVLFALTQTVVEFSPKVKGCGLAFVKENEWSPNTYPYSYRNSNGSIVTSELSGQYNPESTTWFSFHRDQRRDDMIQSAEIYYTPGDIVDASTFVKKGNKTVTVLPRDGYWTEPYYDCLMETWIMQFSVPFYAMNNVVPEFKGVVMLEANLEAASINQCAEDESLFSDSHRCPRESTECKNIPSDSLTVGSYRCVCKPGYSMPDANASDYFDGKAAEKAYLDFIRNISNNYTTNFHCIMNTPAPVTEPDGETILAFDFLVRGIPLGIQSFCMTVAVVIGFVILCLRKTKVMRTSIWILLEMLILGGIFLYATVVIQYFEPTTTTCLLQPWFREMGFAIVYGVLVLKIYRILAEFQSRKAHRVHVRDKDLLKYLAIILVVVVAYMSAWTAVNMDHLEHNSTILEHLYMPDSGLSYILCRSMLWDYVIETGELIFLFCGIYMCYCIRSAPTEYSEGKFITGAIVYEATVSTLFYILRHLWWYSLHPDYLFLMYFLRCQVTVTVVLFIILGPKLWYAHRPPDDDQARSRAYSQSDVQDSSSPEMMKLNVGISSNGDVEVGEISLTEMDPEDIRAELKRLYTQLQIYKTKTMRKDNPHISKRRGGRKQTHRRFSLQAFHHKHRHHHDHDHEHEMSKTPEESTNSAEAMAFTIEPSVKEEPSEGGGRPLPSVSFKSGHK